MEGKSPRTARFRTVIAYYQKGRLHYFEGKIEGLITKHPRGAGGFGYDPVFQPEDKELTFAEMKPAAKNAISHRGKAIQAFANFLLRVESQK